MCGIVGVAGNLFQSDIKIFKDLLFIDTLRGVDSTGVFASSPRSWEYFKKPVSGPDFLTIDKVGKIITTQRQVLIGHNRAATVGQVNSANAHPFVSEDESIAGVHNGTLLGHITKKFIKDYDDYGTDSEALINSLASAGIKETLENVVGAFALAFMDLEKNKLYLTRNKERPMHFAVTEDRKQLYWASEYGMLRWAITRHKPNEKVKYFNVSENTLICWDLPSNSSRPLPEYHASSFKPKSRPVQQNYGHNYGGDVLPFRDETARSRSNTSSSPAVDPLKGSRLDAFKETLQIGGKFQHKSSFGRIISTALERAEYVGKSSCCCCGADIAPESRWRAFPEKNFLCEDCAEDDALVKDLVNQGVG